MFRYPDEVNRWFNDNTSYFLNWEMVERQLVEVFLQALTIRDYKFRFIQGDGNPLRGQENRLEIRATTEFDHRPVKVITAKSIRFGFEDMGGKKHSASPFTDDCLKIEMAKRLLSISKIEFWKSWDKANKNRVPVTKGMLDAGEVPHDPQIRFDDLAKHPTPQLAVREIVLVLDWWRDRLILPNLFPR